MKFEDAIELYNRGIQYKPHFEFRASPGMSSVEFEMHIHTTDSSSPHPQIKLTYRSVLAFDWFAEHTENEFVDRVFGWIKDFEVHEAAEWFRVNGIRVKYPH